MANKHAGGVKAGTTSYSTDFTFDSTTDGTPVTGKVAGDCAAVYWRQGAAPVSITLAALAAITDAWASGGFLEAPGMPGSYRLDIPDAAFAAGADWVEVNVTCVGAFPFKERFALETAGAAEVKTVVDALALSSGTPASIAAAVLASVVEQQGSYTVQQALDLIFCFLMGVTENGGLTIKTPNGAAVRIVGVVDADDERNAITLTPSA